MKAILAPLNHKLLISNTLQTDLPKICFFFNLDISQTDYSDVNDEEQLEFVMTSNLMLSNYEKIVIH